MDRRNVILGLCAALALGRSGHALSPPAPPPPTFDELVQGAKIIVTGVPTAFHFQGALVNDEYEKVFDTPGPGRALYANVRLLRTLKNDLNEPLGRIIQVVGISAERHQALPGGQLIFLIRRVYADRSERGVVTTFNLSTAPIPIDKLAKVESILTGQTASPNKRPRRSSAHACHS